MRSVNALRSTMKYKSALPLSSSHPFTLDPQQYGYYDPAQMGGYGDPNFQAQYEGMYAPQQWYQQAQPAAPAYQMMRSSGEEEPMYVNAKQYHRILKRREARAKLDARFSVDREKKVRICTCWLACINTHFARVLPRPFFSFCGLRSRLAND